MVLGEVLGEGAELVGHGRVDGNLPVGPSASDCGFVPQAVTIRSVAPHKAAAASRAAV